MIAAARLLAASPARPPLDQPPAHVAVPELLVAAVLVAVGLRSLVRWLRVEFVGSSWREHFLYALHVAARVGLWFAFAGFFLGLAVVDRPQRFTWYLLVPLAFAGLQLVTAVALGGGVAAGRRERDPPAGGPFGSMDRPSS